MEKGFFFAILAAFILLSFADAAPRSIIDKNADQSVESRVRYDGAQLWSVSLPDDKSRKVIETLTKELGKHFCEEESLLIVVLHLFSCKENKKRGVS